MHELACAIFDFAGVLGHHQRPDVFSSMALLLGADRATDVQCAYWRWREPYDAGATTDEEYWSHISEQAHGKAVRIPTGELVRLDVVSWLRPNMEVVRLSQRLAQAGKSAAILSNAPSALADSVDGLDWVAHMSVRVFSSDLGLTKPNPEIYRAIARRLREEPSACLMIDDRPENVAGAQRAGMRGLVYVNPQDLLLGLQAHGLLPQESIS